MTMFFDDLGSFAGHLLRQAALMNGVLGEGLEGLGRNVLVPAMEAKIGHYQRAVGEFPAWAPLADSTEDRKAAMGYPADAPLLATGDLLAAFDSEVQGLELVAGSKDWKMPFHEFGTRNMPPRPVVGPAAFENREAIRQALGAAAVVGIVGGDLARGLLPAEIHANVPGYRYVLRR